MLPSAHAVSAASMDDWYRLVAAVLRLLAVLATVLRPADLVNRHKLVAASAAVAPHAKTMLTAIMPRLSAHDIDQEIKECAILAAGSLIAHAGDAATITPSLMAVLGVLTERTRNETTRVPTLRSLAYFVSSPVSSLAADPLVKLLPELSAFLRQTSRPLRQQVRRSVPACAHVCARACAAAASALVPFLPRRRW